MSVSDFVSPVIALDELISKNSKLQSQIKRQFRGLSVHRTLFYPSSLNVSVESSHMHEIFYFTRFQKDVNAELWVLGTSTMDIVIRRNTFKLQWICCNNDLTEIYLLKYK
jgi:hypothetical protein